MTVASSFEQRCPVLFVLHNTTLFLCFLIKWEMGNLLFYYWVKKPFKNPYFTKCAPLKTWCQTLEWHIVLLWLKVYCEFEHVVQKRSLSDGYLLLFKEKPYNKWIANHISLLNLAFWVHNKCHAFFFFYQTCLLHCFTLPATILSLNNDLYSHLMYSNYDFTVYDCVVMFLSFGMVLWLPRML